MQNFNTLITKSKPSFGRRNEHRFNKTRSLFYTHILDEESVIQKDSDEDTSSEHYGILNHSPKAKHDINNNNQTILLDYSTQ